MRTLVVIPTYNEKDNLERIVGEALAAGGPDLSVLVVDDASPDGTGELADRLAAGLPGRLFVMHRTGKLGLGSAYLAGFRYGLDSGFDAVCEMDADGSHDPAVLPQLVAAVAGGADLAIGSRRIAGGRTEGWGKHRNLMSQSAMNLTRWALGLKTRDVTAGFRCYRAAAAAALLKQPLRSSGYAFQEESLFYIERLGFRVVEVPIVFRERRAGVSKLDWREVLKFFGMVARLRLSARRSPKR